MKCSREKCTRNAKHGYRGLCQSHWEQSQKDRIAKGEWISGTIPADEVIAHWEKLNAEGLSTRRICELAGISLQGIYMIKKRGRVRIMNAQKILAVKSWGISEKETSGYVPVLGTARRIQSLVALGYTFLYLSKEMHVAHDKVSQIAHMEQDHVTVDTAKKVAAVFDRLSGTIPEPSKPTSRSKNYARRMGWSPPLAYNNIDDPNDIPNIGGDSVFVDQLEEAITLGWDDRKLAESLGLNKNTLQTRLRRLKKAG